MGTRLPLPFLSKPPKTITGIGAFPEPVALVFGSFDTNTAQGGLSGMMGDYKKLTSNVKTPFTNWLAKNKQTFLG